MSTLSIYWGNQHSSPVPKSLYRGGALRNYRQFFADMFVAEQEHGVVGHFVRSADYENWAAAVPCGDFLITNESNVNLAVLTADCLPIIFFSAQPQVIAIAHAGWRGSVAGIAEIVMHKLETGFLVDPRLVQIFFGPAARQCCYEVDRLFLERLKHDELAVAAFSERAQRFFFDVSYYNMLCLQKCGVPSSNFHFEAHECTICNVEFCSYRRDGEAARLQLSVVGLRF